MDTQFLNPVFRRLSDESVQVIHVRMHVAIREQANHMQATPFDQSFPNGARESLSCFQSSLYEACPLLNNTSRPNGIVAHL